MGGQGFRVNQTTEQQTRNVLAAAVMLYQQLALLLRAGIVVPVPAWCFVRTRQDAILAAVRRDSRDEAFHKAVTTIIDVPAPRFDHIRGLRVTPHGAARPGHERRADLARLVLPSEQDHGNRFCDRWALRTTAATDAGVYECKLDMLALELGRWAFDLAAVPALPACDLPFLADLDVKTLVAIRTNGEALAQWRAELGDGRTAD